MRSKWAAVVSFNTEVGTTTLEDMMIAYSDAVFQRACLYTGETVAAEDVVQTVFLSALRYERFIKNPKAWLAKATRNAARNYLRERSRHKTLELPESLPDDRGDPQSRFEEADIVRAIFDLPDELREVIVLKYYDGYRRREIARMLAIPEGTVASRLARARTGLRYLLERGAQA